MTITSSIGLSLLALLVSFPETPATAGDAVVQKFGNWSVTIQPGPRGSGIRDEVASPAKAEIRLVSQEKSEAEDVIVPPAPCAGESSTSDPQALVKLYSKVYDQIPFSRAEYAANPSYRHDATMEFLFGKMRQTVVYRGVGSGSYAPAASPAYSPMFNPYGFNSYFYPFYIGTASDAHYGWLQPAALW